MGVCPLGGCVWREGVLICMCVCVCVGVILHPLIKGQESSPDFARGLYLQEMFSKWNTGQTKLRKIQRPSDKIRWHNVSLGTQLGYKNKPLIPETPVVLFEV